MTQVIELGVHALVEGGQGNIKVQVMEGRQSDMILPIIITSDIETDGIEIIEKNNTEIDTRIIGILEIVEIIIIDNIVEIKEEIKDMVYQDNNIIECPQLHLHMIIV